MLLVILLGWILLGFVSIYVAAFVHIFKSHMKGYNSIEWWQNNTTNLLEDGARDVIRIVYGFIVWPVRLIEFFNNIPYLYEQYELRNEFYNQN